MSTIKPSLITLLKRDIIKANGSLSWPGILYVLAIPISLFAIISFIKSAYVTLEHPEKFHRHDLFFALMMFLLILCKIPYFSDKPIAFLQFIVSACLWAIAGILLSYAFSEFIFEKK